MGRLKLLIGDEDKAYVESLTGYLMEKFPYKFQVNYFTNVESFQQFLIVNENKTDIILAGKRFISAIEKLDNNIINGDPVVIANIEQEVSIKENNLYKYSNGYNLVKNILWIYEKSLKANNAEKKLHETRIIAIYSPAGGTGKTAVAINLSRYFSKEGHRVFYLNLESINSSSYFFETGEESTANNASPEEKNNLSKVLFALKQKDENLNSKIREIIQYDTIYNIGYFLSPDSFLELDELEPSDIKSLLEEIKQSELYDIVLIDLSSSFNYKNVALMEESHEVFVITTPDKIAISKFTNFLKDVQLYEKRRCVNFLEKMTLIMNRWEETAANNQTFMSLNLNLSAIGKDVEIKLPDEKFDILQDFIINNKDSNLNRELQKIFYKYNKMA